MAAQARAHRFRVGPTDDGKWLAVSDSSPYFVFEGDSSEEVEATANRALDFYFSTSGSIQKVARRRTQTLSSFSSKKVVERAA
jgi:predicted RNase H-like HicB family nuclease